MYDPEGQVLAEYKRKEVSVAVLLAEDKECLLNAKRDLRRLYDRRGLMVIPLPIPDCRVPSRGDLAVAVKQALAGRARVAGPIRGTAEVARRPRSGLGLFSPAPHASKFRFLHPEANILLTGSADGVFIRQDGYVIVDYKTARYTEGQDELLPMYEIQLNASALIGEHCGLNPVAALALVYMEPVTDDKAAARNQREDGFTMDFAARLHPVPIEPRRVLDLLGEARRIYDVNAAPAGRPACEDCHRLTELLRVWRGGSR